MKAISQVTGAWDRIATREELSQVLDVLENIAALPDLGRPQSGGFPVGLEAQETQESPKRLWLDDSGEESGDPSLDASLETLAELFADRNDLVN